jgi:hypothetical protein
LIKKKEDFNTWEENYFSIEEEIVKIKELTNSIEYKIKIKKLKDTNHNLEKNNMVSINFNNIEKLETMTWSLNRETEEIRDNIE